MLIVGARPNFMKVQPIIAAIDRRGEAIERRLVHTGQHYDERMSEAFFTDLGMPRPDINLEVGSASHAVQTARVMMAIEPVLKEERPDFLVVVGDVNSTVACALVATKLGIRTAHVEAGLRSFDRTMPEEINRLCVDAISDYLFTTDRIADSNLAREGVDPAKVFFVGNVMIDSLLMHLERAKACGYAQSLGLAPGSYAIMTLHRPANVDSRDKLTEILGAIRDGIGELPAIFPVHPRTHKMIETFGLTEGFADRPGERGIWMTEPLSYLEFLNANASARLVLTDSGGLQEETTILGVPCVTLRDNTERPVTVEEGTNRLGGTRREGILAAIADALAAERAIKAPEKWDGKAADRIVSILLERHRQ